VKNIKISSRFLLYIPGFYIYESEEFLLERLGRGREGV